MSAAPTYCPACQAVHWFCPACQQATCAHVLEALVAYEAQLTHRAHVATVLA